MLCTTFNLYQTLPGHITAINLKHSDKIRLVKLACLADFPDVFPNAAILLYLLFHVNTPSGLNLVHFGLFYSSTMI